MTVEDRDDGAWWDAGVGADGCFWCPVCETRSPAEDWEEVRPGCELCGDHDGRECPECGEWYDHVGGSREIDGEILTGQELS